MFRRIDDFLTAYKNGTEASLKVFSKLSDGNLGQSVAEGHRTLGQIAWHMVATVPEMMNRTGLGLSSVNHDSPPPGSASMITEAYRRVTEELTEAVESRWSDETLGRSDDMYGEKWLRGLTLRVLLDHEAHHRGQMTVLLRQAGVAVPGVYGPAKEEWAHFGIDAPPW